MSLSYTDVTLERFIKNYSMMFLTPEQQFAFHIYVYCNRSVDQKATTTTNNVYSNQNFQYFVINGPQSRETIEELKEKQQAERGITQLAEGQDKSEIDTQIQFLYDKGFIVRQAKYKSAADKITKSSQLMFKPEKFINQHRSYLKTWKTQLERNGGQLIQNQQKYYCTNCQKSNHYQRFTDEEINQIIIQLQTQKIEDVRCPHCEYFNCVCMRDKISQQQQSQNLLYPIVCELFEQSDELFKRNQEDPSYLDRELQSMRSKYNDFIIRKIRTQTKKNTYITPVERINQIKQKYNQLQNDQQQGQNAKTNIKNPAFQLYTDQFDRDYLEFGEAGIDIKSIHQQSQIVKSERSVVGGVGEYGKVLWTDLIEDKAKEVLNN